MKKNTILFAGTPCCEEVEVGAKQYIRDMNFTKDDVKLIKRGNSIIVEALRDLDADERDGNSPAGEVGGK